MIQSKVNLVNKRNTAEKIFLSDLIKKLSFSLSKYLLFPGIKARQKVNFCILKDGPEWNLH